VRALAFLGKNDVTEALSSARKAHALDPKDSAISTTLGKILMDAHRDEEAEMVLLKAARDPLYRDAFRARTNLGILFFRKNDDVSSRYHLDRAIQEEPRQSCLARHFRGQLSLKQGRKREAIRDFEKAIEHSCAGFGEAHLWLGNALAEDRQYERARRQYLEVQQRFAGTSWAESAVDRMRSLP